VIVIIYIIIVIIITSIAKTNQEVARITKPTLNEYFKYWEACY